jgi:hypothetical protein
LNLTSFVPGRLSVEAAINRGPDEPTGFASALVIGQNEGFVYEQQSQASIFAR